VKPSHMHKEKVRMQRADKPSMQVCGALIIRMQQSVQHLSKSGGMAGTTAEKESKRENRHWATIHGAKMSEKNNPETKKRVYAEGLQAFEERKRRGNNPYASSNQELAMLWWHGWDTAEERSKDNGNLQRQDDAPA
jgi:hypothetical protein